MPVLSPRNVAALVTLLGTLVIGVIGFGIGAFVPGLNPWLIGGIVAAGTVILASIRPDSDDINVPFWLSAVAVVSAAGAFAPTWLQQVFAAPFTVVTGGAVLGRIDELGFLPLAMGFTFIMIAVIVVQNAREYQTQRAIRRNIFGDIEDIAKEYVTLGRLLASATLAVLAFVLAEGGTLFGEFGQYLAEAPGIAASVAVGIAGFLGLGGTIPGVGTLPFVTALTPLGFLMLAAVVVGLAVAAREADA